MDNVLLKEILDEGTKYNGGEKTATCVVHQTKVCPALLKKHVISKAFNKKLKDTLGANFVEDLRGHHLKNIDNAIPVLNEVIKHIHSVNLKKL